MKHTPAVLLAIAVSAFAQSGGQFGDYAVVLKDQPVARVVQSRAALSGSPAAAHLQRIQSAQQAVIAELNRRGVRPAGAAQTLVNAVFVSVDRNTALELRNVPGVAAVIPAPPLKPALYTAGDLVNLTQAQALAPNGAANAGAGVKIGILDSGIDIDHAAFQDSSLTPPAGFPKGETAYTNNKVIVARSFVESLPWPDPDSRNTRPDDLSPRDRVGHGTAIAMIAAGVRNTGPLGTIQGVAPKAFLGNYKVQGSPGVNLVKAARVVAALEQAYSDGMDIVTVAYSEGDMWYTGPLDNTCSGACDVVAQAVETAVTRGMVVVAAAGNDGAVGSKLPTLNTIHSPGTAPSALTVGASTNSHVFYQSVRPISPAPPAGKYKAAQGDGPQLKAALTAPLKVVGGDGLACSALGAGSLTAAIAVIDRGTCAYTDKIINAQAAGAAGVVIVQTTGNDLPNIDWIAPGSGIPAMMVGYTDGVALKNWVTANPSATVTLDPDFTEYSSTANVVADFSSRGPAIGTLGLKPEIVAPGVGLYVATQKLDPNSRMYHPSGYTAVSGTSMSVGFAAGTAALVKQKNASMTPAQIKSAIVNSATTDVTTSTGTLPRATDMGAGKLNASGAMTAATTFSPSVFSFGAIGASSLPSSMTMMVTNHSSAAQTVNFTVTPRDTDNRASVVVSPSSASVPAGQSTTVTVRLQGSQPLAGTYEGIIQATAGSATYRIPYIYMVSDGAVNDLVPIFGSGFTGAAGSTDWLLELKAIDRFGVPIVGTPVTWTVVCPNGSVQQVNVGCASSGGGSFEYNQQGGYYWVDTQTYADGVAAALVTLGTNLGDHVFRATVSGQTYTFYGTSREMPTVFNGGIVDAATFQSFPGYAPGSYVSVFGSGLAPSFQAVSTPALPYGLSDVSVGFYAANGRFPGRLHFVSAGQINVQIPWELQGQTTAKMVVRIGDQPSAAYDIPIGQFSPGIFSNGSAILDLNYQPVTSSNKAKRGNYVMLFCNGLGPLTRALQTGEVTAGDLVWTTTKPTVTIGGKNADVIFWGMTPGNVGLGQVNVQVPADLAPGTQKVVITVGGVASKETDLPVE